MKIKQNEGTTDRVIRIIIGSIALLGAYFWLGGLAQTIAYLVGIISLATGYVGFCGLYSVFGMSTCSVKKNKPLINTTVLLLIIAAAILIIGSFFSNTVTRKKFLENFNSMNNYYKQALFLTGQGKREEAKVQYDLLVSSYSDFSAKYLEYKPLVIRSDERFSQDLAEVSKIISSAKDGVYSGDLPATHKQLEAVRPIFQEMFKRNGFSMLSMALVDFHDIMEEIIAAADAKDIKQLLAVYPNVDNALVAIEKEDNSPEIQVIRKNLKDLKSLADSGKLDQLSAKAAELKTSFIKVYLVKG